VIFTNISYCCQCIFIAHYVYIYRGKIIHIIIHIQCMKFQKFRKIYETNSHATFSRCTSWQERISIFPKIENDCPHINLTETTTWHMNNKVTFSKVLVHLLWLHTVTVYREVWRVGFIRTRHKMNSKKMTEHAVSSDYTKFKMFSMMYSPYIYASQLNEVLPNTYYNIQWVVSQNTYYKITAVYGMLFWCVSQWDPVLYTLFNINEYM